MTEASGVRNMNGLNFFGYTFSSIINNDTSKIIIWLQLRFKRLYTCYFLRMTREPCSEKMSFEYLSEVVDQRGRRTWVKLSYGNRKQPVD